jgi:VanZ family protein
LKKIKPSFVFPVLWLIISTILLTIPGKAFPKENWLEKIWFDKWVHIGMFTIMVFLWCWAMLRLKFENEKLRKVFIAIALLWLAYGIGMEFVQKYLVANRSFDIGDIIADGVGCAVGLIYSSRRYIPKQNLN